MLVTVVYVALYFAVIVAYHNINAYTCGSIEYILESYIAPRNPGSFIDYLEKSKSIKSMQEFRIAKNTPLYKYMYQLMFTNRKCYENIRVYLNRLVYVTDQTSILINELIHIESIIILGIARL